MGLQTGLGQDGEHKDPWGASRCGDMIGTGRMVVCQSRIPALED
jgi:hypothetical protein